MAYLMVWTRKKEVYVVTGKHKCMKTDNINYIQSSLKSHPFGVALYFEVFDRNYFFKTKLNVNTPGHSSENRACLLTFVYLL